MSDYIKNLIKERPETDEFKYMLLDRMKADCGYYLGNGNRSKKYLWAGDEKEHIEDMKALYNSFSDENKPEWLTMADIEAFEKEMTACTDKETNQETYEQYDELDR